MPVPKIKASNNTDLMKTEGRDSLDTVIRQAIGKESSLSFSRAGENPVQWFQLLHALDQQDLPGWPLLTPLKVQMQKCDKCSREFCSSINYRRHIRVHHRLKKLDKDSVKNRELLGTFWDKLSDDEAKEILSFEDVALEEVPGSSIIKSLAALIRKPGFSSLPQYCLRAGSTLLDIIQARPSRFPLTSAELFSVLDDASEKTFFCGTPMSMQRYIFDGEAGKIGLETKNLVACTSFLVEQKLVKVWLADKDAEALRCQKLLFEEEEAAQRRQAELLERKRLKKLRQKEQKAKDTKQVEQADLMEQIDETMETPSAEQFYPSSASDSDPHDQDNRPNHLSSSLDPVRHPITDEGLDLEIQVGYGSGNRDPNTSHIVEHQMPRRSFRWHLSTKSQGNHAQNGFHASHNFQASEVSNLQKHGNRKWSQKSKVSYNGDALKARVHNESKSQPDHNKKREVLIGSISVTLGDCCSQEGNNSDMGRDDGPLETQMPRNVSIPDKHNRPDSSHCSTNRSTVKLWRPVSRNGSKSSVAVENGDKESNFSGLPSNDHNQFSENSPTVSSLDPNYRRTEKSFSLLPENRHAGSFEFSCQAAKAFLNERWKEAIAGQHVNLVLLSDIECTELPKDCPDDIVWSSDIRNCNLLGNTVSKMVEMGKKESSSGAGTKARFKSKHEKGVKYILKQRAVV